MKFGTIYVDPPWPYRAPKEGKKKVEGFEKLTGFASEEYPLLSMDDLRALPVKNLGADKSVLVLWATFALLPDALSLFDAWGYEYKTAIPWVKVRELEPGTEQAFKNGESTLQNGELITAPSFTPIYGVGYWFRGAAEVVMFGARGGSYRTNYVGLLSENAKHTRKPDTVFEIIEKKFPAPYLGLFARRRREGWPTPNDPKWTQLGYDLPGDGRDIRESIKDLL